MQRGKVVANGVLSIAAAWGSGVVLRHDSVAGTEVLDVAAYGGDDTCQILTLIYALVQGGVFCSFPVFGICAGVDDFCEDLVWAESGGWNGVQGHFGSREDDGFEHRCRGARRVEDNAVLEFGEKKGNSNWSSLGCQGSDG